MTRLFVGPAPLVDLGTVGETDLLGAFDADVVIPEAVAAAVSTEPARTNLETFLEEGGASREPIATENAERAMAVLGVEEPVIESRLLEPVLGAMGDEQSVGLVTDDRHLRTIVEGLGATVTGTFGTVVRAASEDKYLKTTQAKRIVRRIDSHGLHLTGELRAEAIGDL